ncbi:MAG: histidine kinase [Citromicrobium sp.]|nr:histidine kinase [Citromicrobium sp.]MAO96238.1 histidine kinase [Citromicrobium sp.]MBD76503.1 histidine kinase [Citromicrobium sp.]MBT47669.1 histidine kinase [Citromicrobium sp.]
MPVLIFLLITAITALSVFAIERGERRREQAVLSETAQVIASSLDQRVNTSGSYLVAGASLISTLDRVPATLFRRFATELRLDADYRGSVGIGWSPIVPRGEIGSFEQLVTRETGTAFKISPLPSEASNFAVPVTFFQPMLDMNRRAIGYNMYAETRRREAMQEAIRTGRPTATGPLDLVQDREARRGFIVYMPVFEPETRGEMIRGFVYSPFNSQDFLDSVLTREVVGSRGVRLYDGEPKPANLIASHAPEKMTGNVTRLEVSLADRPMTVEVESARGDALSLLSMITLLFGIAVASLSMLVARLLTQQAHEDQAALDFYAEQNSIRNSLTRELNHRVKNTLANVLSIVALTRRRASSLEDFASGLDGRIRALSATHDLLTQSEWGTTPLLAVLEAELAPYASAAEATLDLTGPDVELAPNDALSFGLAMHELATNAAKYGALSVEGGTLKVSWTRLSEDLVEVVWQEGGGPPVPTNRKRGFGTELIEKIVAHELKHPVDLRFESKGVRCVLRVPIRRPTEFRMRARRSQLREGPPRS